MLGFREAEESADGGTELREGGSNIDKELRTQMEGHLSFC